MSNKIIVQRSESGNRTEYAFKSLAEALKFIADSEKGPRRHTVEGLPGEYDTYEIDGAYELYMPRSYK